VGQMPREMHGVLTRAAAYFQNLRSVGKAIAQHPENGLLIALAGFGEGQHSQLHSIWTAFKSIAAETAIPGSRAPGHLTDHAVTSERICHISA